MLFVLFSISRPWRRLTLVWGANSVRIPLSLTRMAARSPRYQCCTCMHMGEWSWSRRWLRGISGRHLPNHVCSVCVYPNTTLMRRIMKSGKHSWLFDSHRWFGGIVAAAWTRLMYYYIYTHTRSMLAVFAVYSVWCHLFGLVFASLFVSGCSCVHIWLTEINHQGRPHRLDIRSCSTRFFVCSSIHKYMYNI